MQLEEFEKMYEVQKTHWWYCSRTKLVSDALKRIYNGRNDLRILDLASACGYNFEYFGNYGEMWGLDISAESIKYCKMRGIDKVILGDALSPPLIDGSFDLVIALDAFEHFLDDVKVMHEMNRVLKRKGVIVITSPALMQLWSVHDVSFNHFRRYTVAELTSKLKKAGFEMMFISYWTTLFMIPVYFFRKFRSAFNKEPKSDFFMEMPKFANKLLGTFMKLECWLLKKKIRLPLGVSVFCIARKI